MKGELHCYKLPYSVRQVYNNSYCYELYKSDESLINYTRMTLYRVQPLIDRAHIGIDAQ